MKKEVVEVGYHKQGGIEKIRNIQVELNVNKESGVFIDLPYPKAVESHMY